jgi:hypothetical protein
MIKNGRIVIVEKERDSGAIQTLGGLPYDFYN